MRRTRTLALAAVLGMGCSSSSTGGEPPPVAAGGSAGAAAGRVSTAGASGSASGGSGNSGAGGSASELGNGGAITGAGAGAGAGAGSSGAAGAAGTPGMAGAAGSTAGAGGSAPRAPFTCSEVLGLTLTKEWYVAGFEQGVVDAKWQLKAAQSAYVDEWAKLESPFWSTPLVSACEVGSASPDRVVLAVLSWTIMTQADWERAIGGAVTNIASKYPHVARIDLMTIVRGPGNAACGDPNVYAENTHIPMALDAALTAVSAGSPSLVYVAPQFAVDACSDFKGVGPHLTDAGNAKLAGRIATAFAREP